MSDANSHSQQSCCHPSFRSALVNDYTASGWFMVENRLFVI